MASGSQGLRCSITAHLPLICAKGDAGRGQHSLLTGSLLGEDPQS